MQSSQQNYAVLFADVAGSTRIYEKFGDTKASQVINDTLVLMSKTIARHSGYVIKTIGDEVMCRFPYADNAVEAACEIHETLERNPVNPDVQIAVRIGLHFGPALLQDDGDLLGDVVNVAARMTGIAKARQIITTSDTIANLAPMLKDKCREFDRASVKGKTEEIIIYEIVWEPKDVTRMAPIPGVMPQNENMSPLVLQYQNQQLQVSIDSPPILMGRGQQCDLIVDSQLASRSHAFVKYNRGKYTLVDQSTNGTFIRSDDGQQYYLRRENLPLTGSGVISLGEAIDTNKRHLIYYKL